MKKEKKGQWEKDELQGYNTEKVQKMGGTPL